MGLVAKNVAISEPDLATIYATHANSFPAKHAIIYKRCSQ